MIKLRRFRHEDSPAISRLLSDADVSRFLGDSIICPYPASRAERFVQASIDGYPLDCAIEFAGELAGAINLMEKRDVYRVNLEIGYWIGKPFWHRGIAREAIRQMTRVAFRESGIERVYANVFVVNEASCRVLECCGYHREGLHPAMFVKRGNLYDGAVYAVRKEAWCAWDEETAPFRLR